MGDDRGQSQLREALGCTAACPGIEELVAGLERGEPHVRAHCDGCSYCQTQLALYREFEAAAPSAEEARDVRWIAEKLRDSHKGVNAVEPSVSWWQRWTSPRAMIPLGLAFACLLVVVTVVTSRHNASFSPPRISENETLRSSSLELIQPEGQLSEAPGELRWKPVAGASTYQAEILEVDGNPLWTASASGSWVAIPSDIRKRIVPGKRLLWRVSARRPDGSELLISETKSFNLRVSEDTK
jgi:hypothetical protein